MRFALLVLGLLCDSLTSVYYTDKQYDIESFRRELTRFMEKERVVYPKYMQAEKDDRLKASIDSLFHDLMQLCISQNALPNVKRNGSGMDISIQLFHILSVSDSLLQKRWAEIFPFVEKAFDSGEISNSYFFMYDRLLYRQCGKQYFGGMGKDVPIIDDAEPSEREKRYRMNESTDYFKSNEQWKRFYDEEERGN